MRFLVTGASGFIGGKLAEAVLREFDTDGNEFVFMVRSRVTKFLNKCLKNPRVRVVQADVTDIDSLAPLFEGVDYVFHAAAKVDYGCPDTQEYYRTNVEGSANVFELCLRNGVKRVINISTAGIFHPAGDTVVHESTPLSEKQTTRYTHSKFLAYQRSLEYIGQGVPIINILPSAVFGEGSPLFAPLLKDLAERRVMFLPALRQRLSLVHVGDLVDGIIRVFLQGSPGESYCFSGRSLTFKEIARTASEVLGDKAGIVWIPPKAAAAWYAVTDVVRKFTKHRSFYNRELFNFVSGGLVVDHSRAEKELGFTPADFDRSFRQMIIAEAERIHRAKEASSL